MTQYHRLMTSEALTSPWRHDFPALLSTMNGQPLVYLDSGASAQKPFVVINAMTDVMSHGYANVHRGLYQYSAELTARFEEVRGTVARFIGAATPENIVFTRNATEAINLVAQSWGRAFLKPGDEIIITEMEHHANIVPWQLIARATGAVIKIWPITDDGRLQIQDLAMILTPRTRVVAVTQMSNVLGTLNDIRAIIARCKSFNPDIITVVDGSQGVVHGPVGVTDLGCDFYAFTGHKLYGPTGVGILYGRHSVLQTMPPFMGGGDMIDRVSFAGTTYRDAPYRFEAGTPAIVEVIGLGAAIDYITAIGWPAIVAHEQAMTTELGLALRDVPGVTVYGPAEGRGGIFAFTCAWGHASDVAMILDQCGVAVRAGHHCAMPLAERLGGAGTIRASLGLYNDSSDIAALIKGLNKARGMLM
jgi:cysteine desulfurase / selenocysteine lyase